MKKIYYPTIIIVALMLIFAIILRALGHENCIIHYLFNYPCPSCGLTRAYLSLLKGNFKESFYYHPAYLLIPISIILYLLKNVKKLSFLYKKNIIWCIILLIFIGTYIIRIIISFPKPFI